MAMRSECGNAGKSGKEQQLQFRQCPYLHYRALLHLDPFLRIAGMHNVCVSTRGHAQGIGIRAGVDSIGHLFRIESQRKKPDKWATFFWDYANVDPSAVAFIKLGGKLMELLFAMRQRI